MCAMELVHVYCALSLTVWGAPLGPSPLSMKHAQKTCTCRHAHGFLHTETCAVKHVHACLKHVHACHFKADFVFFDIILNPSKNNYGNWNGKCCEYGLFIHI